MLAYLISIASYILYSLGLYTIAARRGIRHAWLAWVPVGSVWILGSIADGYRAVQTGRRHSLRIWVTVLTVATSVLLVAMLVCCFVVLGSVLSVDEMTDFYLSAAGAEDDLYAVSQEEMIEDLSTKMEARMTDEAVEKMLTASLVLIVVCLLLLVAAIATSVLELICTYWLFASCDPQNKVLFFCIGLVIGVMAVFVFLCRNKDLGMQPPQPPVMGYMPPTQE